MYSKELLESVISAWENVFEVRKNIERILIEMAYLESWQYKEFNSKLEKILELWKRFDESESTKELGYKNDSISDNDWLFNKYRWEYIQTREYTWALEDYKQKKKKSWIKWTSLFMKKEILDMIGLTHKKLQS